MRISWITSPWLGGALLLGVALGAGLWFSDPVRSGGVTPAVTPGATGQGGATSRRAAVTSPALASAPAPAQAQASTTTPAQAPRSTTPVTGPAVASTKAPAARGRAATSPGGGGTEVVFELPWGTGLQALGHRLGAESAPEGPASFALGPEGTVWVLDQVNFRVLVVRGGRVVRSVPLLNDTYEDLAVDGRGGLVLVDRLMLRHLARLDAPGRAWRFVDLEGPGLPEGGGATGLFLGRDGAWVEWAHQHVVRVADAGGVADRRRPIRWGRRSGDGQLLLRAARGGSHEALVLAKDARAARAGVRVLGRVAFARPLTYITALGSDGAGNVVLGVRLVERARVAPYGVLAEEAWAVVLRPDGREVRRVALAVNTGPEEQHQALRVGPDGSIYQLAFDDRGATLRRYRP